MSLARTAKADFRTRETTRVDGTALAAGTLVKAGQVVEIANKTRLKQLAAAGVVAETDEENEAVPRLAPPPIVQPGPEKIEAIRAARAKADNAKKAADKAQADLDTAKGASQKDAATIAKAQSAADATRQAATQAQAEVEALDDGEVEKIGA